MNKNEIKDAVYDIFQYLTNIKFKIKILINERQMSKRSILYIDKTGCGHHNTSVTVLEELWTGEYLAYAEEFKCFIHFWKFGEDGKYMGMDQP